MSLLLIASTLIFASNAVTEISHTWLDDFMYNSNGINGWDDDSIINGTFGKYHGWYAKNNDNLPTLSRSFQCAQPSDIQLSFIIYFGCDIEGDETITLYLNDEEGINILYSNLEINNQLYDVNETVMPACSNQADSIGFKGSNITNYTINIEPVRESTTFTVKFEFGLSAGISNEFGAISDIKIQCLLTSLSR